MGATGEDLLPALEDEDEAVAGSGGGCSAGLVFGLVRLRRLIFLSRGLRGAVGADAPLSLSPISHRLARPREREDAAGNSVEGRLRRRVDVIRRDESEGGALHGL